MNTVDVVGDEALTNSIIDRSITEVADNLVTSIGEYAFYSCHQLTTVSFHAATSMGQMAFCNCRGLTTARFPAVTSIGYSAVSSCTALATIDFPVATRIDSGAFQSCSKLTALILRSETMATLSSTTALSDTPIESGTGYIYVPRALLSDTDSAKDYRRASNWSTYAAQFRAIEDYPEICDPYSWDVVAKTIAEGTYKDVYKIGDTVPLDLGSEGVINMQIAAFDTDVLADGSGTAAISWIGKELLATPHRMNPNNTPNSDGTYPEGTGSIGGWEKCEMRAYLQESIKPRIPDIVRNHLVAVSKTHPANNQAGKKVSQTTADDVWIPSTDEVYTAGGIYAELFPDDLSRIKRNALSEQTIRWWLRSAAFNSGYDSVSSTGAVSSSTGSVYSLGVCLGFCTGKAT